MANFKAFYGLDFMYPIEFPPNGDILNRTGDRITLSYGPFPDGFTAREEFTGRFDYVGGDRVGGVLESYRIIIDGDLAFRGTGLDLDAGEFVSAALGGAPMRDIRPLFSGDDRIQLASGGSEINAGAGDDRVVAKGGDDFILGGAGNDTIIGGNGRDRLKGGAGADKLNGGGDDDRLFGNGGADTLKGGAGADVLKGGGGDDLLVGGSGADILYGGAGADVFQFNRKSGHDRIMDFKQGTDRIEIRGGFAFEDLEVSRFGSESVIRFVDQDIDTVINVFGKRLGALDAEDFIF